MSEDTSCGCGKDVNLFQKGQIIGMHQAKKTSKEIAETTKIGLRTVQYIIKTGRIVGNHHLWGRNVVGQKSSMIIIGNHLNVWWNQIVKKNNRTHGYVE